MRVACACCLSSMPHGVVVRCVLNHAVEVVVGGERWSRRRPWRP
jgi:hypothetical protein